VKSIQRGLANFLHDKVDKLMGVAAKIAMVVHAIRMIDRSQQISVESIYRPAVRLQYLLDLLTIKHQLDLFLSNHSFPSQCRKLKSLPNGWNGNDP
jgi:hypothetical protein